MVHIMCIMTLYSLPFSDKVVVHIAVCVVESVRMAGAEINKPLIHFCVKLITLFAFQTGPFERLL